MKALPATDPCSWTAQAAIDSPGFGPAGPCEHGNMSGLASHLPVLVRADHRAQVRHVRLVAALLGLRLGIQSPSTATQRQIPAPFRVSTSQLYDGTRNSGLNGGGSLATGITTTANGFTPTSYMTAQGAINGTPHGAVHVAVGGNMSSFPTADSTPSSGFTTARSIDCGIFGRPRGAEEAIP